MTGKLLVWFGRPFVHHLYVLGDGLGEHVPPSAVMSLVLQKERSVKVLMH
jgi:hypothetical protein